MPGLYEDSGDKRSTLNAMIFETTEEFMQGSLLSHIIDDFIFEECIDMMWRVRTNGISLDEIYGLEPLESIFAMEKLSGLQTNSSSSGTVSCPLCNELVAGRRFAPHLEKCMNGGKRGSKRHYDYLHDEPSSKVSLKPKVEVTELIDPHPKSLIVRIKLRNGVPRANLKRTGATLDDFQSGVVGVLPEISSTTVAVTGLNAPNNSSRS